MLAMLTKKKDLVINYYMQPRKPVVYRSLTLDEKADFDATIRFVNVNPLSLSSSSSDSW